MKKLTTGALALIAGAITALSAPLTPEQALTLATSGSERHPAPAPGAMTLVKTVDSGSTPALYVFDNSRGGFMIVAADDAMTPLVLSYSDRGTIDGDAMPPALVWALDMYARNVAAASDGGQLPVGDGDMEPIEPFVTTTWNQTKPYNDLCPVVDGLSSYAGCVPVAMAQAMKYYNYPERGTGTYTNAFSYKGVTYHESADFGATVYDWNNMLDSYGNSDNDQEQTAVATLIRDCGVACHASYSPTGTGSNDAMAAYGMTKYFGYDKGMRYLRRSFFTADQWQQLVYDQLAAGYPVMYAGVDDANSGHEFIVDGYNGDGLFHINWGWGGISNGYFSLSALNPYEQGAGGGAGSEGFNWDQSIIAGIRPQQPGSDYVPMMFVDNFHTAETSYPRSNTLNINIRGGIFNGSIAPMDLEAGLCIHNVATGADIHIGYGSDRFEMLSGFSTMPLPLSHLAGFNGTFIITPVFRTPGGDWQPAMHNCQECTGRLIMTLTDSEVTFSGSGLGTLIPTDIALTGAIDGDGSGTSPYIMANDDFSVTIDLYCVGADYDGAIQGLIAADNGSRSFAQTDLANVDLTDGESATVTFAGPFGDLYPGNIYHLLIVDEDGDQLGQPVYFTIDPSAGILPVRPDNPGSNNNGLGNNSLGNNSLGDNGYGNNGYGSDGINGCGDYGTSYFTIGGIPVASPTLLGLPGLYIRRSGPTAFTLLLK